MPEGQTLCIYCQEDHETPLKLRRHIEREHPGTYAERNVNISLIQTTLTEQMLENP